MKLQKMFMLLFLTGTLAGCGIAPSNTAQAPIKPIVKIMDEVSVGVHSWPGGGIVYIGDEMGFFKKQNIDLKIKKIESFDTKRAALISGDIDVDVANTMDQLLIYKEAGFDAKIIGVSDQSVGGDGLVASTGIKNIQDLKGKRIAYAEASPSDFFLRYILEKNNINIEDVDLKPVADPQIAGNAMIAGRVDAAVTYEPYLSQAAKKDDVQILSSTKEFPTLIPGLLIANGKKINKNRGVYNRFMKAWYQSADYYYKNRDRSEKIISKGMGMDLAEVKDILSVVAIQRQSDNKKIIASSTEDNLLDLVKSINIFWKKNKFITKDFKAADLIEARIISQ